MAAEGDRRWVEWLTVEEKKILNEIDTWVHRKDDNVLTKALKVIEKPIEAGYNLVPDNVKEGIGVAIAGVLSMLRDSSKMTISSDTIMKKVAEKTGHTISFLSDIKRLDMRELDRCASECITFNKCCAAAEGGGTGVVGWPGLIVDIPALYGMIFRVIQEVALCYGYHVDTPEEKIHILKVLEIGHTMEDASKRAGLIEVQAIQVAIRRGVPWREIEKNVFVKALRELAKKLGLQLTKRKLAQALMVVGAVIGAGANYLLVQDIGTMAYYAYRMRLLRDRGEERMAAGIRV